MDERREYAPTFVEHYIQEGRRKFTIYVMNEFQKVPARLYLEGVRKAHPETQIETRVLVNQADVKTGTETRAGHTRIRYHHS